MVNPQRAQAALSLGLSGAGGTCGTAILCSITLTHITAIAAEHGSSRHRSAAGCPEAEGSPWCFHSAQWVLFRTPSSTRRAPTSTRLPSPLISFLVYRHVYTLSRFTVIASRSVPLTWADGWRQADAGCQRLTWFALVIRAASTSNAVITTVSHK